MLFLLESDNLYNLIAVECQGICEKQITSWAEIVVSSDDIPKNQFLSVIICKFIDKLLLIFGESGVICFYTDPRLLFYSGEFPSQNGTQSIFFLNLHSIHLEANNDKICCTLLHFLMILMFNKKTYHLCRSSWNYVLLFLYIFHSVSFIGIFWILIWAHKVVMMPQFKYKYNKKENYIKLI
jgi:hypothetical protein